MERKHIILVGMLALSYLAMVIYLTMQYAKQVNVLNQTLFGVVMVVVAIAALHFSKKLGKIGGIFRVVKVAFASFALVMAAWMLLSVILLPIVSYKGFEFLANPTFIYWFLGASLLVSPVIAKKLA